MITLTSVMHMQSVLIKHGTPLSDTEIDALNECEDTQAYVNQNAYSSLF